LKLKIFNQIKKFLKGETYGQNGAKTFLSGSYNFKVAEIEVFKKSKK